ncbi:MAG TPA: hypothetical protein VEI94_07470 [Candidatus Bathyarchaeia archaeon]|nr:hypothetical protein [Candidatus Bathyarchaeia archaeon]
MARSPLPGPWSRAPIGPARAVAAGAVLALLLLAGPVTASSRLAGNVVSVDTTKREIILIDAGKKHTVSLGPQAVLRKGTEDKQLGDLHHGDRIVVTFDENGAARLVSIAGPAAPSTLPVAPRRNKAGGLSFLGGAAHPSVTPGASGTPGVPASLPTPVAGQ